MRLEAAIEIFDRLLSQTQKRSELKTYEKFIAILMDMGQRGSSETDMQAIEQELEDLQLSDPPEKAGKYYRKRLAMFTKFLREKFSLILEGHYTALGVALGPAFGVALGTALSQTSMGIGIGVAMGLAIGAGMDKKAKQEGRVLNAKMV